MTYEPTKDEIKAGNEAANIVADQIRSELSLGEEPDDEEAQERIMRAALIAAHAARPVPESAVEIVRNLRDYEDATCAECGNQTAEPFFITESEAASIIQSYADAARASDRALIEEAATALEGWQEWWEMPWEAKRPDIAQLRYNKAAATLAKLRSYSNEN